MGFSRLSMILPELIRHGKDPDTPAAAVSRASCAEQQSVTSTLVKLEDDIRAAGLTTPAVVIIGPVVGLRPAVSWFEARPLFGRRVLVTRPRHQAADLLHRLELLGASSFLLPAIEIRELADWSAVDAAQEKMRQGGFDWLIFTSVNGVDMFLKRLRQRGRDLRDLGSVKLAAVGTATAAKLRESHLEPDIVPAEAMSSEGLLALLKNQVAGKRGLLAAADRGRELIRDELARIAHLETVAVYTQVEAIDVKSEVFDLLRRGEIDFVTLTSSNIVRSFLAACDETIRTRFKHGDVRIVSGNPRTTATIEELGLPVAGRVSRSDNRCAGRCADIC